MVGGQECHGLFEARLHRGMVTAAHHQDWRRAPVLVDVVRERNECCGVRVIRPRTVGLFHGDGWVQRVVVGPHLFMRVVRRPCPSCRHGFLLLLLEPFNGHGERAPQRSIRTAQTLHFVPVGPVLQVLLRLAPPQQEWVQFPGTLFPERRSKGLVGVSEPNKESLVVEAAEHGFLSDPDGPTRGGLHDHHQGHVRILGGEGFC